VAMPEPSQETLSQLGPPPHFTIFGVPVRITSTFWFMALLFGMQLNQGSEPSARVFVSLLTWVTVVFFSILLHELGHALTARAFGARPTITLYMMGGLTRFEGGTMSRAQSGLISLAGPMVGLAAGFAVQFATKSQHLGPLAAQAVAFILFVNIQ